MLNTTIKDLVIKLLAATVTILSLLRMKTSACFTEFFIGLIIFIFFGIFFLYLMFEKQIKIRYTFMIFLEHNSLLFQRLFFIIGGLAVLAIFIIFPAKSIELNIIRLVFIFLFCVGILICLFQIYKNMK